MKTIHKPLGFLAVIFALSFLPEPVSAQSSKCCCEIFGNPAMHLCVVNLGGVSTEAFFDGNCMILPFNGTPGPSSTYSSTNTTCNGAVADSCASACATLPVEFSLFTATLVDGGALLSWETASESNNSGFEVQHANPKADFELAAFVEGHGTSTESQSYSYYLGNLSVGNHRFRLKQIDFNGAFVMSSELQLLAEVPGDYQIASAFPNPFGISTTFSLAVAEEQNVKVEVFDLLGKRVALLYDGHLPADSPRSFSISGQLLPNGTYLYRATGERFISKTERVVLSK